MEATAISRLTTRDLTYIAACTALLAVCSWISIPTAVPFTLQTMGIFLTMGLLGGRRGTLAILTFILLAAVGAPVLAGFTGGLGVVLGSTGGYILGFLLTGLVVWGAERLLGSSLPVLAAALVAGMALCYAFGTAWFMAFYARTEGPIGLTTAFGWCVTPFLVPDSVKLGLSLVLIPRLRRHVR